eukprot:1755354-Rhodomonas_salina.1
MVDCPITIFLLFLTVCIGSIWALFAFVIEPDDYLTLSLTSHDPGNIRTVHHDTFKMAQEETLESWTDQFAKLTPHMAVDSVLDQQKAFDFAPFLSNFFNASNLFAFDDTVSGILSTSSGGRRLLQAQTIEAISGVTLIIMFHQPVAQGGVFSSTVRKETTDFLQWFEKLPQYSKFCKKSTSNPEQCRTLADQFEVLKPENVGMIRSKVEYTKGFIEFNEQLEEKEIVDWYLSKIEGKLQEYAHETGKSASRPDLLYFVPVAMPEQLKQILFWDAMRGVASIALLAIYMVRYFGIMNIFVFFVALTVGVDDIFVATQYMWQSRSISKDLHSRVRWMLPRAAWAMFVTSFTSAAAFFSTCMSPLVSTCSFGIFAGTAVLVDYILVVFLFIPTLVVYHKIFPSSGSKGSGHAVWFSWTHILTRTYKGTVSYILGLANVRAVFLGVWVLWLSLAVYFSMQLDSETAVDLLLPEDNHLQKATHAYLTQFGNSTDSPTVQVSFTWGLAPLSRDGVNLLLDPDFLGGARYSKGADFQEEACKSALWDMVGYLKNSKDAGTVQVVDQVRGDQMRLLAYKAPPPIDQRLFLPLPVVGVAQGSITTTTNYVSLQFPLKGLYPGVFESVEETEKVFDQVQTLAAFLDKTYVARHCKTPAASFMITDDFE